MNSGVATVSLFFSIVAIYIWNYTHWTRRKIRQGFQVPLFGDNFRHFFGISAFQDVLQGIYDKFPDRRYSGFYQYLQPGLMIKDPELIKTICMGRHEHFMDRTPFLSETNDVLWNKTLFALRGREWREMRNTLTPAFTCSKMRQMFFLMVNLARQFTRTLKQRDGEIIEIEFKDISRRFANDLIALVAYGLSVNSLTDPENEFFMKGLACTNPNDCLKSLKMKLTLIWPSLGRILRTNIFDKEISNFFRNIIQSTIEHRRANNEQRNDMLQLLMEVRREQSADNEAGSSRKLDVDDIASQALVFFLGGFDTVSTSMCFMAYELADNQDVQTKLIEEIDEYRQRHPVPKYEHICHLPYLDMVLAEIFRKWPPILNLDRICTKQYDIDPLLPSEQKITIEKDDLVWLPIWCIHHDPKYWPEPEKFDPERFSVENKPSSQNGTYIPFGLGRRSCLGSRFAIMQVKLFFFELLQKFRIVTISRSQIPFVPIKHTFNLASKYNFWFGLQKRFNEGEVDEDEDYDFKGYYDKDEYDEKNKKDKKNIDKKDEKVADKKNENGENKKGDQAVQKKGEKSTDKKDENGENKKGDKAVEKKGEKSTDTENEKSVDKKDKKNADKKDEKSEDKKDEKGEVKDDKDVEKKGEKSVKKKDDKMADKKDDMRAVKKDEGKVEDIKESKSRQNRKRGG